MERQYLIRNHNSSAQPQLLKSFPELRQIAERNRAKCRNGQIKFVYLRRNHSVNQMVKQKYRQRIADALLSRKLAGKGAVVIEGAKWCGKTTTAEQQARSILYMTAPGKIRQNIELSEINPLILLRGEKPRLIDEWQVAPKLWDSIRFEVDHAPELGQYILTGSQGWSMKFI